MEIQIQQIIFQIINFSVVVGALTYLLYKPIVKILEERAEKVQKGQQAAQKSIEEADKIEELKQKAIKDGQKEAAKLVADAKDKAKDQANTITKKAKEEASSIIDKMKEDFDQGKKKELKQMKLKFSDAVVSVSEKVLMESLTEKKHQKLIDKELEEIFKAI